MALIKVFVPLVVLFNLALSSPLDMFYMYPLVPYSVIQGLDRFRRICPENTTSEEKFQTILGGARKCYGDLAQSNQSICHGFEVNVQKCSQPLVDFFVDCLPEKSKDLPPAIVKVAASVVETFCTSSGEILLEAMNLCLYEYLNQRNKTIKDECKEEILQPKLDKFEKDIPSKSEACQVAREIGDCWQEYVNQDCESLKARELYSKFYSAVLSPCKINEI